MFCLHARLETLWVNIYGSSQQRQAVICYTPGKKLTLIAKSNIIFILKKKKIYIYTLRKKHLYIHIDVLSCRDEKRKIKNSLKEWHN